MHSIQILAATAAVALQSTDLKSQDFGDIFKVGPLPKDAVVSFSQEYAAASNGGTGILLLYRVDGVNYARDPFSEATAGLGLFDQFKSVTPVAINDSGEVFIKAINQDSTVSWQVMGQTGVGSKTEYLQANATPDFEISPEATSFQWVNKGGAYWSLIVDGQEHSCGLLPNSGIPVISFLPDNKLNVSWYGDSYKLMQCDSAHDAKWTAVAAEPTQQGNIFSVSIDQHQAPQKFFTFKAGSKSPGQLPDLPD